MITLRAIEDYLGQHVLPFWWENGRCSRTNAWFEGIGFDGVPLRERPRRGRVWPRQLVSFSMAYRLGLFDAPGIKDTLAANARHLLHQSRLSNGQFAGGIDLDGQPTGEPALLYDLAFYALAGAELAKLDIEEGYRLADAAFAEIDTQFRDARHGGYFSDHRKADPPKLANPHMHLLEAAIAWFDATSGQHGHDRIVEILSLFREHFLRADGHVQEALAADYSSWESEWIEPGHGFEWAYLYCQAMSRIGTNDKPTMLHITQAAETSLINGLAPNRLGEDHPQFRLWPQLERLRVLTTYGPEADIPRTLNQLNALYLSKGPSWGWNDEVDQNGSAISSYVPASMVYHLVTAFGALLTTR